MTWKELRARVESELERQGANENFEISFIELASERGVEHLEVDTVGDFCSISIQN